MGNPLMKLEPMQRKFGTKNLRGLIKALTEKKDEDIRHAVIEALGQVIDTHAVEPLIASLEDVRWAAGASRGA